MVLAQQVFMQHIMVLGKLRRFNELGSQQSRSKVLNNLSRFSIFKQYQSQCALQYQKFLSKMSFAFSHPVTRVQHYTIQTILSDETSQAKIYLCSFEQKLFVIKMFFKRETMESEAQFLSQLNCSGVVKLYGTYQEAQVEMSNGEIERRPSIVLEFLNGGSIFDLVNETGPFSEDLCRSLFSQLIEAIQYIHSKNISHLDIKPENILVSLTSGLKIADFGLSAYSTGPKNDYFLTKSVGTDIYWAPEVYTRSYNGEKADLFSLGIILFIMATGCRPFSQASLVDKNYNFFRKQQYLKIYWQKFQERSSLRLSQSIKQLFSKLFKFKADERPNIQEIKQSQWMKGRKVSTEQISEKLRQKYNKMIEGSGPQSLHRQIQEYIMKVENL